MWTAQYVENKTHFKRYYCMKWISNQQSMKFWPLYNTTAMEIKKIQTFPSQTLDEFIMDKALRKI